MPKEPRQQDFSLADLRRDIDRIDAAMHALLIERGDVTVLGSVASGAEIMAGGSVHVYGTLRGRAIAGFTGNPRARVTCKAGDICAMPADIRHQGFSPKRSMLLVWENASNEIPKLIGEGKAPVVPVTF